MENSAWYGTSKEYGVQAYDKSPALKSRGFFAFETCLVALNSIGLISSGLPFILPIQHSKLWSAFYPADTAFF